MLAQYRGRAHGIDGLGDGAAHGLFLQRAGNAAKERVAAEKSGDSDGERTGGHFVQCSKALVIHLLLAAVGVEIDDLDGEYIVKDGRRIVEGQVAVGADAAADDINRRGVELRGIERGGLLGIVAGLQQVHLAKGQQIEDVTAEPEAEALRRSGGEAEVLIHVEGDDARPIDSLLLAECGEHLGLAGGSGEDDAHDGLAGEAGAYLLRDLLGGTCAHGGA